MGHSTSSQSDFRYGQNLQTSKHGQAHTIQIVRAHARDLTMAAAGHAYGMAPVCDRYECTKSRRKQAGWPSVVWM